MVFEKKISDFLPPASGSKGFNEIKLKQGELFFHPHYIYEG